MGTRLSGIRNTASTTCFVLQANQQRTLFSFFNVSSLKLKGNQSLSACVNDKE
ncbi:type II secretory pathway, pseudopilin [Aggregatibacter actinomycetemcomitans serotype e str. SC1083]|uniref:Type II secretory pathway, pseudopilin n=1 Tax=Aggregatibacter actinomycetemcomitans serotype e str. SC1083 TaxID=907488 RepID=G4A922_AGGAC|nr:type II secretory pathway, pseudopilin [Aggregatibacter actinomycetemcomitans serotype e str. SC1083]